MKDCVAGYSKGQMKIQQMAFMLVVLVIFFSMVALVYFAFSFSGLKAQAQELRDDEAREIARKLASTPEFAFTSSSDCSSCIDFDKALIMKDNAAYTRFWNLDYLMIERIYPKDGNSLCAKNNYPDCNQLVVIDKSNSKIATKTAFVALAYWDQNLNDFRYELGRVHVSGNNLDG